MSKQKQLIVLILLILTGCDSTRTLYSSSGSKDNSWKVNAYTMSHCGCTQLFVEKFRDGKNEFQIMYTDAVAVKNIYNYNNKGVLTDTIVLRATTGIFDLPFDSLDHAVFQRLKTIVDKKEGLVYDVKWTEYKGYNKED